MRLLTNCGFDVLLYFSSFVDFCTVCRERYQQALQCVYVFCIFPTAVVAGSASDTGPLARCHPVTHLSLPARKPQSGCQYCISLPSLRCLSSITRYSRSLRLSVIRGASLATGSGVQNASSASRLLPLPFSVKFTLTETDFVADPPLSIFPLASCLSAQKCWAVAKCNCTIGWCLSSCRAAVCVLPCWRYSADIVSPCVEAVTTYEPAASSVLVLRDDNIFVGYVKQVHVLLYSWLCSLPHFSSLAEWVLRVREIWRKKKSR